MTEEADEGRSGGRLAPGGKARFFASKICTVRRPGLRVVSVVVLGLVPETADEMEDFSVDVPD